MYTSFIQITPDTLRIKIETPWNTAAADYAEACGIFGDLPVPGYPEGKAPVIVTANRYSREIRAEAVRRCAARLIHSILQEKGIRAIGPVEIVQASLEPGQIFRCTVQLTLRPNVSLPNYNKFTFKEQEGPARRDEIKNWLLKHTHCDLPEKLIRRKIQSVARDSAQPDSLLWDEAAHTALLQVISHEIAQRTGITISEEQLGDYLEELAAEANTSATKLRVIYNQNGQLEALRDVLLIEAVLNHLAQNDAQAEALETAAA